MKKSFIFSVIITAGLLLQTSCADSFLDPKPKSFYTPENAYKDQAGFESALLSMRKNLKRDFYFVDATGTSAGSVANGERHLIVAETACSDVALAYTQPDFGTLTPSSSKYFPWLDMFIHAFVYIKDANVCISRIDEIEWKDKSIRDAIVAEAMFHRAYWYYRLVNNYGDIPISFEEITGPKLDFETYSRWRILDKLEKDLEFAASKLPAAGTTKAGAVSAAAANHLLAKVYLANLQFDKAIEAATRVINGPNRLMTERFGQDAAKAEYNLMWDLHRPNNVHLAENTETILACIDRFEAPSAGGAKTVNGTQTMRNYHPAWWNSKILDSQGKPGCTLAGIPYTDYNYHNYGRANPNVVNSNFYRYDAWTYGSTDHWTSTTDLRRADINWVDARELKYNNPASVDFGKPVDTKLYADIRDTFFTYFGFPHYITYVPCPDPGIEPKGSNGDWYVFRLAETYLIRAEAHIWKQNQAAAADDINAVRARAKAKLITPAEATIDFLFDERARELFAEEPRHCEMARASFIMAKLNMNGYTLANIHEKNWFHDRVIRLNNYYHLDVGWNDSERARIYPRNILWPIPQSIIVANTKKEIKQNKGYEGGEKNITPLDIEIP